MGLGYLWWRINQKHKSQTWKKPKDTPKQKGEKEGEKESPAWYCRKEQTNKHPVLKSKKKPKQNRSNVFIEVSGSRIESDYRRRAWVWPCAPSPSPRCTWPTIPTPPWSSVQFAARSSAGLLSASVTALRTRVSCEEDPSFVATIQRRRLPHTWAWQIRCFFVEVQLHGNIYALFLWPPSDRYPTKYYYYNICTYIYSAGREDRRQAAN
jgi:hypothetical protein